MGTARAIKCAGGTPGDYGSMDGIEAWLQANPGKADAIENMDPSFIFFVDDKKPPLGVNDTPLTGRHTVAVDPANFPYEIPVFFATSRVKLDENGKVLRNGKLEQTQKFQTLALAQDKGGAIKDCHIDTYWDDIHGGTSAGHMDFSGTAFVALPK